MLSSAEAKIVRGLRRRKIREAEGLFLAEGIRVAEELLASGVDLRLAVAAPSLEDTPRGAALRSTVAALPAFREVAESELARLADTEAPQGILLVGAIPRTELEALEVRGSAVILVLDGVQDPGNVGTLVRTADAFGALAVAALPGTADPWNPKVVRAAAGSLFRVPVLQPDRTALLEWLGARGFTLCAASAQGEPIEALPASRRVALVLGNEGAGVDAALAAAADAVVAVPIRGGAESLNVAVAGAILLYLLTRNRWG